MAWHTSLLYLACEYGVYQHTAGRVDRRAFKEFEVQHLLWIVEQSIACPGRDRRLAKAYEYGTDSSEARALVDAIGRSLRWLARGPAPLPHLHAPCRSVRRQRVDVSVPAYLRHNLLRWGFGAEGMRWLADLPRQIAALAEEWGLRVGPPFDKDGAVSWVAPVELRDGAEAVLKITLPHDEPRFEAHALRFLDGRSAVRLLDASGDGFSLLLERCRPGTELWSLGEVEGNTVASRMLPRLWRDPEPDAPFVSLADHVARWWHDLPRITATTAYDGDIVAEAVARGRELAASQPQRVLLHGDFHPGNVLAAEREPWLCIDPKPLVGEPAYDLAQWLYNRARFVPHSDDGVAVLRQQVERFAVDLGLDPARIAGWAFVKALGMDFGPAYVTLLQQVARAWAES